LIRYETADGVGRITLDRPEKRNALHPELIARLQDAFERAGGDPAARVILLCGAGPDFCAGLDLASLAGEPDDPLAHLGSARALADLYLAIRRLPKPVIAAVHGRAYGGGAGLATACDLIVAAESAEFRYPEVNLGFVAAIVMSMLRRVVGEKRVFEMAALGEAVRASAAAEYGLVNHVYPDAGFDARAAAYAEALAAKSASALLLTKDLLYHIDGMTLEAAVHAGLYGNALARMTADAKRGIESFARKRTEKSTG
jgi:methylglutaconyl-CoA hydratase